MNPTIILPAYNGTRYLGEAILSVLRQSYSKWRLLVIDDASSDDPANIVRDHADPRITYIQRDQNIGLYPLLSLSLAMTDAEWVCILMQDDRLKPTYLEQMIDLATKYPTVQAIWATEDIIGEAGEVFRIGKATRREELIQPGTAPWASALRRGCIWTISGSFTRRSLLTSIPFRGDLPHCGDFEWLLRAIRQAPFLYFECSLIELRQHAEQASAFNLRSGRDVEESYQVVKENLAVYGHELSRADWLRICSKRSRVALARATRSCARLRLSAAGKLFTYGVKFLQLPLLYATNRLFSL